ncbi:baseplate assembly protein [Bacillus sp. B-jedd]|uniref:baseplate assembly protein n=1 Tax=Bacillus sp. B-jedd TaxID=1476857 RepID=UPI000515550A|nr:baseplate J/gp47 family protein [Bacillus sp. B-jedd]CEG29789.1 Baseplate J-like protein [Bacillus sp. B-jedd]
MNRFNLPDINFLEKDPEAIEQDMLLYIEEKTGITLSNADPRRKFLQGLVLYVVQERNNLDYALKQNLLAYAEDDFLDHLGEGSNTQRLDEKGAETIIEFTLEEGRVSVLVVPAGTLISVGADMYFETIETVEVPVGQHSFLVNAICTEAGEKGNGYLPGEIATLVYPLPWVKEVKNITTSAGGAEVEENDQYADRIRLAPERFSVAGPAGAYEYWAKTASSGIVDVKALSPSDGVVDIRVLLQNGQLPSQSVLDAVLAVCSDKTRRPLTDKVTVGAPDTVLYDLNIEYYVAQSNSAVLNSVQSQVQKAFQDYLIWQKEKMGRSVDLTELIVRLKETGASRVVVNSPMYIELDRHQVAKENTVNLVFRGLADG